MATKLTPEEQAIVAQWEQLRSRSADDLKTLLASGASVNLLRELALIDFELRWRQFNRRFARNQPPQLKQSLQLLADAGFSLELDEMLEVEACYIAALFGGDNQVARLLESNQETQRGDLQQACLSAQAERKSGLPTSPTLSPEIDYRDLVFERMIGRGGSGRVYLARRKSEAGKVAVKALYRRLQHDPLAMAMFEQEAETLQQLQHPHIVRCLGIGRFPTGGRFLVLEHIDGGALDSLPPNQDQRRQQFWAIAEAVQHAHQIGVIHGDLKPQNILLTRSGEVRITDFGLAQLPHENSPSFRGGTIGYMAPEELNREGSRQVAADIFALGGVLYFLATGQHPTADTLPDDSVNRDLIKVIQRCRQAEVADRYATVAALLEDLSAVPTTSF